MLLTMIKTPCPPSTALLLGLLSGVMVTSSTAAGPEPAHHHRHLFNTAVEQRRDEFGYREHQRHQLQELLGGAPAATNDWGSSSSSSSWTQHLPTHAERAWESSHRRVFGRNLQSELVMDKNSCTFDHVLAGACSISDFCHDLVTGALDHDAYCLGNLNGEWQIVVRGEEVCLYNSLPSNPFAQTSSSPPGPEDMMPFDETLFNPETDYCLTAGGTFYMNQWDAARFESTIKISRPFERVYRESSDLEPCFVDTTDSGMINLVPNYCKTCAAAEIDGMTCNSCSSCPASSVAATAVDCSNLDPTLMATCDGTVSILEPFLDHAGVECTFDALVHGECTLETFCQRMSDARQVSATCKGDVTKSWFMTLDYDEVCLYKKTTDDGQDDDDDSNLVAFDPAKFNPKTDYCLKSQLTIDFTQSTPHYEEYIYHVTRPAQDPTSDSSAMVREISSLSYCGRHHAVESVAAVADYVFGSDEYCYKGCPAVTIGELECNAKCLVCDDGYEALDCSNVQAGMVESCSIDVDDNFVGDVVQYFVEKTKYGNHNPYKGNNNHPKNEQEHHGGNKHGSQHNGDNHHHYSSGRRTASFYYPSVMALAVLSTALLTIFNC